MLILARTDDEGYFNDPSMVGHADGLKALMGAGARVELVRASCICQGKRLASGEQVAELVGKDGETIQCTAHVPLLGDAAALARGLTHIRCLTDAANLNESEAGTTEALIVLEASARLLTGPGSWGGVLKAVADSVARGDDLLFLARATTSLAGLASAYAITPRGRAALVQQVCSLRHAVADPDFLLAVLAGQHRHTLAQPLRRVATAPLIACGGNLSNGAPRFVAAVPSPITPLARGRGRAKVVVISLAHRADRRVEPLVGSPAALAAIREAGMDAEVLRASCYCERDCLNERGSLACLVDGACPQWFRWRRYEGAEAPMSAEEAHRLRSAIDQHYESDADRLIDPGCGGVETYVKDTNWPGATGCAMSHLRALIGAAAEGYDQVVVFEDDAVLPAQIAREKGWCDSCNGEVCLCPEAWAQCCAETVELLRRRPGMDCLYLGLGEQFEEADSYDGLIEEASGHADSSDEELGGVTQIGYTWCAQGIGYNRSALDDVLTLKLWELLWAQDETLPHLYCRKPWNHRFVRALRKAGWKRRWIAGAPSECFRYTFSSTRDLFSEGWVHQLENMPDSAKLGLGTAGESSNSQEF